MWRAQLSCHVHVISLRFSRSFFFLWLCLISHFHHPLITPMSVKAIIANVPSLTKALVSAVLGCSLAAYVYIYRLQVDADPETVILSICPFIGLLPGL